jgi:flavin reductase (DIM6/NTAB) family NADH-FMN oxidoreductase RutF
MAEWDTRSMETAEAFHLLNSLVAPRPIAWVSTLSEDGVGNLAPFSYFALGGANPPSCVIVPLNDRDGASKDTLRNIEATGEYVINVATRSVADALAQTSFPYDPGVDERIEVGLTARPSRTVAPPRVAESPIQFECRVHRIVPHGDGPLASRYVIGEILRVHVDDELLDDDGRPDDTKIPFVARMGRAWYTAVTPETMFEIPRPAR